MDSSESDEDFIAYGTALEPLEEDEIPSKKPCFLEDQIVTDKQNRRRFHGAFTGGFSAGFFNTVGSLEGWTPSSFKSSRSKKQKITYHKPEDFMDEEDLSEFGIAPVVLKAKQDYTNDQKETHGSLKFRTLGTYVLQDLLKPARETVGIKLLKKMGWKPGQGVGPRLSRKEKENASKTRQKIYGCQLPFGFLDEKEEVDENSDTEWDYIEFAPNDYEPFLCEAKNNFSGIGYEGLDKTPVLSSHQSKKSDGKEKNQKFGFSSQAFGIGAFEEEEEDEDIYAKDDMSRYDFVLGNDQSKDANKLINKDSKTQDGVLDGFVLQKNRHVRKKYGLPVLPKDFKGRHEIRHSRFDQPRSNDNSNDQKSRKITSEDRKKLIGGEEELEAHKQKEKLTKELISDVKINKNKFRPFSNNPDKQERYENYLKLLEIGQKERLSDLQPLSMSSYDKEREVVEFEKTALLFKPLTGEMEDRFLTASQPDDLPDPPVVVEKCINETNDQNKVTENKTLRLPVRSSHEWFPSALLCTRFNVRQLKEGSGPVKKKDLQKKRGSYFEMYYMNKKEEIDNSAKYHKAVEKVEEKKPEIIGLNNPNFNDQDKTDLFKAIFLEDDDDDDDDKTNNEEATEAGKSKEVQFEDDLLYEEKLINSKRNLSPPSGIFKNIDLELLSGGKKTGEETEKNKKVKSVIETVESNSLSSNLVYGPKIPEKIPIKTGLFIGEESKDDGVWVEKKLFMKEVTKNKNKKHKKALHKSKHKHKKHKR